MAGLINNKKGIGFFALVPLFILISFGAVILFSSSPNSDAAQEALFLSDIVKKVDDVNSKIPAEVFFKEQVFERNIEKIKRNFNDFKFLDGNYRVERIDSGCKIEGREIWYNEYNIFEKINKSGTNNNCFPNLSDDIKSNLLFNFQVEMDDLVDEGFSPLGTNSYDVLVEDNDEDGVFDFIIEVSYEDNNKLASFRRNTDFTFEYDASEYIKLITVLENIFPKISDENKKTVPSCLNGQTNGVQNSEKICIKKNILDLISKEKLGKEVLNLYNFDIELFNSDIENYFGIDIIAKDKKFKEEDFVFSLFLKYNIPHNLIEFNVDHFTQADKTIEVIINEPKISKDRVYSYLVFYSYENFFDKSSYSSYDKLFELLETSQIPKTFESEGVVGKDEVSNIAAYYHSSVSSNLNLNLLAISKQDFDSKGQKKVLIYQIYDFEEKKYMELEEGRPVYVFVFAVDSAFNYYLDKLDGRTKYILPSLQFGPSPLFENNLDIVGEIENAENSILAKITNYQEISFDHYDIYLMKNRGDSELSKSCVGASFSCFYYNGFASLRERDLNVVLSSNTNLAPFADLGKIIQTSPFNLENGNEYELLFVPVDKNGNGIVNDVFKEFIIVEKGNSLLLEKNRDSRFAPIKTKVLIKDNSPPDPLTSIVVNPSLTLNGDNLHLIWTQTGEPIKELKALITVQDMAGQLLRSNQITISKGSDGFVTRLDAQIGKVSVTRIIPIDESGNPANVLLGNVADSETQSAMYSRIG